MKYAIVKTGGKQYRVNEGDIIEVEKLDFSPESDYIFENVLLYVADKTVKVGTPILENVQVLAKILGNVKGEKIRVSKFKSKVRYRRVTGHRQDLTRVQIKTIGSKDDKPVEKQAKKEVSSGVKKTRKTASRAKKT